VAGRATWNPLRSEQEAFQFLIAAMGYFGAIAIASALGGVWAGVSVFAVLTAASVAWFLNRNRRLDSPDPVGSREPPIDAGDEKPGSLRER
jgi:4-amino-4-deoxy-L-arabinose transferase-like glycosyltransferase